MARLRKCGLGCGKGKRCVWVVYVRLRRRYDIGSRRLPGTLLWSAGSSSSCSRDFVWAPPLLLGIVAAYYVPSKTATTGRLTITFHFSGATVVEDREVEYLVEITGNLPRPARLGRTGGSGGLDAS